MRFRVRRRSQSTSSPQPVYVVWSGHDVDQVFVTREDAEDFAHENPDARVSPHQVRGSVDEAVMIFERRVVVQRDETVLDRTYVVRRFIDSPHETLAPADVEWFHDNKDDGWHIVGFGSDKAVMDTKVQDAIDLVRGFSRTSSMEGAR